MQYTDFKKYKRYAGSEDNFQISVANILDSYNAVWAHVANERKTQVRQNKNGRYFTPAGNKLKAKGVKRGVPDCLLFDKLVAIELKVGYNKPSDEQIKFMRNLEKSGWKCYVSWSLDEVIDIVKGLYYK